MSKTELKNKIAKSLDELDAENLQSAYLIIRELLTQQKFTILKSQRKNIDEKINAGLKQLDNGESRDFGIFLNELQAKYGR